MNERTSTIQTTNEITNESRTN